MAWRVYTGSHRGHARHGSLGHADWLAFPTQDRHEAVPPAREGIHSEPLHITIGACTQFNALSSQPATTARLG
jgi:hypothetical protein